MSDWLYPLSSASGRGFHDENGDPYPDTSFDSFQAMMERTNNALWVLTTNFRRVDRGDRVWCYYGSADRDLGVVGVGEVFKVEHDNATGYHNIDIKWKAAATKRLMKRPVPASEVRRSIPVPRRPVQALDPHRELVKRLEKAAGL